MDRENNRTEMGLNLNIEIDSNSGFCYGVIRAIKHAERFLVNHNTLHSLGAIVHNNREIERLAKKGMDIIDYDALLKLKNNIVFIRAHGEPPETYILAKKNGNDIIDCTCPVVLKLQQRIREAYEQIQSIGGILVIFGKRGHAEVNGLIGQVDGNAVIIESLKDLDLLDFSKPISLFSQTTKDIEEYNLIIKEIIKRVEISGLDISSFKYHNTICKQVSSRYSNLKKFASSKDSIIFVSGKESSNGKALFEICKHSNENSYKVEGISDIDKDWFKPNSSVGICGATSTPNWQLEEISNYLSTL